MPLSLIYDLSTIYRLSASQKVKPKIADTEAFGRPFQCPARLSWTSILVLSHP